MEYKVIEAQNCYDSGRLENEIVANVKDGWELVSVAPHPEVDKGFFLIYKR